MDSKLMDLLNSSIKDITEIIKKLAVFDDKISKYKKEHSDLKAKLTPHDLREEELLNIIYVNDALTETERAEYMFYKYKMGEIIKTSPFLLKTIEEVMNFYKERGLL